MRKLYLISSLVWPVFLKIQRLLLFHNLRNQYVFLQNLQIIILYIFLGNIHTMSTNLITDGLAPTGAIIWFNSS